MGIKQIPYSVLSTDRINRISALLQSANHLEGDIAEVGSYKGGSGHYLNVHSKGKRVFLFDTFNGIPMKGELDAHPIGDFGDTSFETVKEYFSDSPNVSVVKGIFPYSAKGIIKDSDRFCFVHIDADQYESTIDSLEFFYPKMVQHGIIVCDDWKWLDAATKAINDFFETKKEKPIDSVMFQCFIIKS